MPRAQHTSNPRPPAGNVIISLPSLLVLFLLASSSSCFDLSDSLNAIYQDGAVGPMMAEAISDGKGEGGSPVVWKGGSRIVPKGFDQEMQRRRRKRSGGRLNDKYYTFHPDLNKPYPQYGKGPVYRPLKKFPRLLPPWPFSLLVDDPIRPFPDNTVFIVSPIVIIPFTPFGIFEIRLPVGFMLNYVFERLHGVGDENGRRSLETDQLDLYVLLEDLLTNTFALNGRQCVQRLVCDLARNPVRGKSLMGEVLHSLIEPRSGQAKVLDDYVEAEVQGHRFGECRRAYPRCPFSIANLLGAKWDTTNTP